MVSVVQAEPMFEANTTAEEHDEPPAGEPEKSIAGDKSYQAFVNDQQTRDMLAALAKKGTINPTVHAGGVKEAIETMSSLTRVKLLIVDLSGSQSPMNDIEALADVCEPGLAVVTLGEVNDIHLYRSLIDAGVAEYLVKPISEDTMLAAIETALTPSADAASETPQQGHVTGFIGSRGGVGSSTITMNYAACLASRGTGRTILIDLNLAFGSIALSLDLDPGRGLREALEAPDRVDNLLLSSAAAKVTENFYVMASEEDLSDTFRPTGDAVRHLLDLLRQDYDRIVVELPRDLACRAPELLVQFNKLVLVSDLSLVGLRDTNRMLTHFKDHVEPEVISVAVNRVGLNRRAEITDREFEKAISRSLAVAVPDDPKTSAILTREARPVGDAARGSKLDKAIQTLCEKLWSGDDEPQDVGKKRKAKTKPDRKAKKAAKAGKE